MNEKHKELIDYICKTPYQYSYAEIALADSVMRMAIDKLIEQVKQEAQKQDE